MAEMNNAEKKARLKKYEGEKLSEIVPHLDKMIELQREINALDKKMMDMVIEKVEELHKLIEGWREQREKSTPPESGAES